MFWFIDDAINYATNEVWEFVENPIKKTAQVVTQPVRDWLDIIDWLTEWEIREKAILRLWADVASWMAISELIEWYKWE